MEKTDIAWAAGFIDGEAHINHRAGTLLTIGQKDRNALDRIVGIFKIGRVRDIQVKYKGELRPYHTLSYCGNSALAILRLLLPYLTTKKSITLECIQYAKITTPKTREVARWKHKAQTVCKLRNAGYTFNLIGKMLGVTRQRAHQLYNDAPSRAKQDKSLQFTFD